jgi:hypothetical protein
MILWEFLHLGTKIPSGSSFSLDKKYQIPTRKEALLFKWHLKAKLTALPRGEYWPWPIYSINYIVSRNHVTLSSKWMVTFSSLHIFIQILKFTSGKLILGFFCIDVLLQMLQRGTTSESSSHIMIGVVTSFEVRLPRGNAVFCVECITKRHSDVNNVN